MDSIFLINSEIRINQKKSYGSIDGNDW